MVEKQPLKQPLKQHIFRSTGLETQDIRAISSTMKFAQGLISILLALISSQKVIGTKVRCRYILL